MSKNESENIKFNPEAFISESENNDLIISMPVEEPVSSKSTKKRSSKKKDVEVVESIPIPQTSMSYIQENIPYQVAYNETNQQLDHAIHQLNALGADMMADINMVRSSKTMKNKYNIVNDLTENAVSIINAKIAAIKEKNKTINDVNNLEIRRIKELKLSASNEDDNTRIANMYHAFVNYPMSQGPSVLGPNVQDVMFNNGPVADMTRYSMGMDDTVAWQNSLNPAEQRMVLEAQGKIETVVVYDESSGNRYYSVVDKNTRQPVPNVETPDDSTIYNLDINVNGMYAKDINRNVTYPLVVINGSNSTISKY